MSGSSARQLERLTPVWVVKLLTLSLSPPCRLAYKVDMISKRSRTVPQGNQLYEHTTGLECVLLFCFSKFSPNFHFLQILGDFSHWHVIQAPFGESRLAVYIIVYCSYVSKSYFEKQAVIKDSNKNNAHTVRNGS